MKGGKEMDWAGQASDIEDTSSGFLEHSRMMLIQSLRKPEHLISQFLR